MPPDLRLVDDMDEPPPPPPHDDDPTTDGRFFVPLGHDRGRYYVSTVNGGQVLEINGDRCSATPLMAGFRQKLMAGQADRRRAEPGRRSA
jgi:hypothetical protein